MDANTGPAPTRESVLLAMRSDLGMTRVDDLELENGRRGQTIRTGMASAVITAQAPAPPRQVLPVANKWKTAIKSGAFDDDDAEAVKGLDRIGSGRLHALNAGPTMPAQNFPGHGRPPPGLPPPGFEQGPQFGQRRARPISIGPIIEFGRQDARFSDMHSGRTPGARQHSSSVSLHFPSKPAHTPMGFGNVNNGVPGRHVANSPTPQRVRPARPLVPPEAPMPDTPKVQRPKDPEPAGFVYKENIRVADRLAKGVGAVYLVAPSDSNPGTFHIYLEGSKYLEYPIVSMYNYMTTSTDLCPQFKDADGVSTTTTRLVFGNQDKIIKFMTELRALKARKPEPAVKSSAKPAAPATPMKPAESFADSSSQPAPPVRDEKELMKTPSKPEKDLTVRSAAPRSETSVRDDYEVKPAFERPVPSCDMVLDYGNDDCGKAFSLVDLSQPAEAVASRTKNRLSVMSTYASDLGSLQSSHFVTSEASSEPGNVTQDSEESNSHNIETAAVPVKEPAAPVAKPVAKPAMEPVSHSVNNPVTATHTDHPQKSSDVAPVEDSKVLRSDTTGTTDSTATMQSLQASLLEILPKFEVMNQILANVDESKREAAAKSVYTNLQGSLGNMNGVQLSSAERLLKALIATPKTKPTAPMVADTVCSLRYDRKEMKNLRERAVSPPEALFKLDFLPKTSNRSAQKTVSTLQQRSRASTCATDASKSTLKPTAETFQPSPPPKIRPSVPATSAPEVPVSQPVMPPPPTTQVVSAPVAPASQSEVVSPTALSDVSKSSISTNLESLTARMSRLSIPDAQPKPTTKGLQGSRWAASSKATVRAENANRFMGIAIPQ